MGLGTERGLFSDSRAAVRSCGRPRASGIQGAVVPSLFFPVFGQNCCVSICVPLGSVQRVETC